MHRISVLPAGPFDTVFSYLSDEEIEVGRVVEVPFGFRSIFGVVVPEKIEIDIELKRVSKIFPFKIESYHLDFLNWVASYTLIPRGQILKMILAEPSLYKLKKIDSEVDFELGYKNFDFKNPVFKEISLNSEQQNAYEVIKNSEKPVLFEGITGSGKTEVYLKAAQDVLKDGGQVLVLFPEIILTSSLASRIEKYFAFKPLSWNSTTTPKARRTLWLAAYSGHPNIFIGTRSALFLPFKNLRMIVIDEEHDSSYKQEENGCYNARDMAVVLAKILGIKIVLASATVSVESFVNAKSGKYDYVSMKKRFGNSKVPEINLIDIRQSKAFGFISATLEAEILRTHAKGEQSLLFLNRRGFAPITLCKACGEKIACTNCDSWLVYHKKNDKLICHYCGYNISVPKKCLTCASEDSYIPYGPGVERICEELGSKFPNLRVAQACSDTLNTEAKRIELINKVLNGEVDVIVGTQILSKGLHFPNITLSAIIDGDLGLFGADIRSSERIFQMTNQVAGRAGREDKRGLIMLQTYNPDHSLYKIIKAQDTLVFMEQEIGSRRLAKIPPFSYFAAVIISGNNKELTRDVAYLFSKGHFRDVEVLGPAPAPIFLLRGRSRWRILLKSTKKFAIQHALRQKMSSQKFPTNVKIQIDIDPISFF